MKQLWYIYIYIRVEDFVISLEHIFNFDHTAVMKMFRFPVS